MIVSLPVRADLIAYDSFDYADGNLNGENGGEGEWTGNWNSGAFQAMSVASGMSLSYQSGATTLPTTGGHLLDTDGGEERAQRTWNATGRLDQGDQVWFSLLINVVDDGNFICYPVSQGNFDHGIGFRVNTNGNLAARIDDGSLGSNFDSGGAIPIRDGETHFVVGRITFSTSSNDEVRIWVDPSLDVAPSDASGIAASLAVNVTESWNQAFLRTAGNGAGENQRYDEVRIGTDFFSVVGVTVIPEPSSFFYLGIAAVVGLIQYARAAKRRRAT
jgi:hypothetical protein